ncbi:MAG: zinc ribbon domain-containing protein [Peptococcaceae bacterium]|nr:zinc ribbon domain-containing protein [Peptococcaceae bacterium]
MPIFEFRCLECGELFEKLFLNPAEEVKIACPKCKAETFERVISKTNYVMGSTLAGSGKKTTVTTKSCGSGSNCVTLDIPGVD